MESILVVENLNAVLTSKFRMLNPSIMGFHMPGHLCLSGCCKLAEDAHKIGEFMECFLVLSKTCFRPKNFQAFLAFEAFSPGMTGNIMSFALVILPECLLTNGTNFGSNF